MRYLFTRQFKSLCLAVALATASGGGLCELTVLHADEITTRYFEQLRSRRMFNVAEGYCLQQLSRKNVSPARRALFVIELSKTLSEHAKYTAGAEQADLWKRAAQTVGDFIETDPRNPNRSWLEAQRALVAADKGDVLRWQAELYPEELKRSQLASLALSEAVSQLNGVQKTLDEELRSSPGRAPIDPEVISLYHKRMLLYETRLQLAATLLDRARLFPVDSRERERFLSQADGWLKPLARGSLERNTTWDSKILLAESSLLRNDVKQAESLLTNLQRKGPSPDVRDRITAVRVQIMLDSDRATDAGQLLNGYRRQYQHLSGKLRYLKTRMFAALWEIAHRENEPDLADQLLAALADHVKRAERDIGGYWGYRCRVLQKRAENSARYGPELALLVRQAETSYREGQTQQAVKVYTQVVSRAEEAGKRDMAAEFRFTLASILLQDRQFQVAADSFRELVQRSPQSRRLIEAHLLWAYCLGKLSDQNQTDDSREAYLSVLELHREKFPEDPTAVEATWMLARLLESQLQPSDALPFYLQIPSGHRRTLAAQVAMARCYESIIEHTRKRNGPVSESEEQAIAVLSRIVESYPQPPKSWSREESEVGLRLSRIFLNRKPPQYANSDLLLERIFSSYPHSQLSRETAEKSELVLWKTLLKSATQLRIVSLAGRNRLDEAHKTLRRLTDSDPAETLAILDGLTQISSGADPKTQRLLGELQLHAVGLLNLNQSFKTLSDADQYRLDGCLAQAYVATNQPGKAITTYESLLKRTPNDPSLLQAISELLVTSKSREQLLKAKSYRRKLESLHRPGSQEWFEARYWVARICFDLKQYDECRKLTGVTRLLYPELGGEKMREKFTKLQQSAEKKRKR
ncbi:MAG: tetratricopeptide repeat protein [Planctomycetes bacterium]|nr:tetratricopeptide repeat protein [Planctomycetota bacterium]